MMRRADGDQIGGFVRTALGTWLQVVHVEKDGIPAAGDATAPVVTMDHRTAQRRRDLLFGTRAQDGMSRQLALLTWFR